jgi:glycosyltransferase involved in cell wall biosynthesis
MRVPTIWTIHANEVGPFNGSIRTSARLCAWLSKLVPRAIHYCSVEGRVAHETYGFHPAVSTVIVNGINVERYAERNSDEAAATAGGSLVEPAGFEHTIAKIRRNEPESRILGCIARFHSQKDHDTLLRSVANLSAQGRIFYLVLAGDGCNWDNEKFADLVDRYKLRDRVIALGAVPNVERLYGHLDCVVLSSAYGESMPLCLLEALAAGKPIVATDVGATRTIIGPFGIVTPPLSADAMVEAIERVVWGSHAYQSSARLLAPAYVQHEFGLQQWTSRWERMLSDVVLARGARRDLAFERQGARPEPGRNTEIL